MAIDANSIMVTSLKHELEAARQEVEWLRSLAFVPSSECSRPNQTWKDRAAELTVQLEQLQPDAAKNIQIEWLSDEHDCETCGASWAGGAVVRLNGKEVLDLSPVAACYDESSYSVGQVFCRVLELLGYSVTNSGEMDESD